jgi:hypothetical protein
VRADRLPLPAAQDHAMTTMTLTARPIETRLRPLYATGFILGALLSACVAHYASLRLEYFLTIPLTCCAFFTLRRWSHGIFEASAFVVGALIVVCATVSMMVKRQ